MVQSNLPPAPAADLSQKLFAAELKRAIDVRHESIRSATRQIEDLEHIISRGLDMQNGLFHVRIYDTYGNMGHYKSDDADVTRRGLEAAVKAAESKGVRTDGALSYSVSARFDQMDVTVPEKIWLKFSKQTAKTLKRR